MATITFPLIPSRGGASINKMQRLSQELPNSQEIGRLPDVESAGILQGEGEESVCSQLDVFVPELELLSYYCISNFHDTSVTYFIAILRDVFFPK
jgi:hypothetical protein